MMVWFFLWCLMLMEVVMIVYFPKNLNNFWLICLWLFEDCRFNFSSPLHISISFRDKFLLEIFCFLLWKDFIVSSILNWILWRKANILFSSQRSLRNLKNTAPFAIYDREKHITIRESVIKDVCSMNMPHSLISFSVHRQIWTFDLHNLLYLCTSFFRERLRDFGLQYYIIF